MINIIRFTRLIGFIAGVLVAAFGWMLTQSIAVAAFISIIFLVAAYLFFRTTFSERFLRKDFGINIGIPYGFGLVALICLYIILTAICSTP